MRRPVEVGRRCDLIPRRRPGCLAYACAHSAGGAAELTQRDDRRVDLAAGSGRGGVLRAAPSAPRATTGTNCSAVQRCRLRNSQIDRAGRTGPHVRQNAWGLPLPVHDQRLSHRTRRQACNTFVCSSLWSQPGHRVHSQAQFPPGLYRTNSAVPGCLDNVDRLDCLDASRRRAAARRGYRSRHVVVGLPSLPRVYGTLTAGR